MVPLGVTTPTRSRAAPQIPALAENPRLKGYDMNVWFGLFGPARLPAPMVARLNRELNDILREEAVWQKLQKAGISNEGGTPQALTALCAPKPSACAPSSTRPSVPARRIDAPAPPGPDPAAEAGALDEFPTGVSRCARAKRRRAPAPRSWSRRWCTAMNIRAPSRWPSCSLPAGNRRAAGSRWPSATSPPSSASTRPSPTPRVLSMKTSTASGPSTCSMGRAAAPSWTARARSGLLWTAPRTCWTCIPCTNPARTLLITGTLARNIAFAQGLRTAGASHRRRRPCRRRAHARLR